VAREDLALALATDCMAACCAGMPPGRVLVVTSDRRVASVAARLGARVVGDPGHGLDAAVRAGREAAIVADPAAGVAVLLGDLPAVRPEDLLQALDAASAHPLALVPDASGTGTVLLTALAAGRLQPAFGGRSAERHEAAGHVRLDLDLPRLRTDVDDDRDLEAARSLGVGPATQAVLAGGVVRTTPAANGETADAPAANAAAADTAATALRATLPDMQASVHTFDEASGAGSVLLDDGREVAFSGETFAASALRHLRPGQRLSIALDEAARGVTRLWIVGIGDDQTIG
jgi:2-phospho-L-lactate guanylyltransferase